MSDPILKLDHAILRANPAYELIPFERLPLAQQQALATLCTDADFYGILQPRPPNGSTVKSITKDTALLLLTLQTPGPLPTYAKAMLGNQGNQTVAQLLLDSVLEIEHEGKFVTGADAFPVLYGAAAGNHQTTFLAKLATNALTYAQALPVMEPYALSMRLYFYHRLPLTPQWQREFPTDRAVADYLGIHTTHRDLLDTFWLDMPATEANNGWLAWQARSAATSYTPSAITFKLYISPHPRALNVVFAQALPIISTTACFSFKVGRTVDGLLRPDKMVAYFRTHEDLAKAAEQLTQAVGAYPAHGVPFTAPITANGLLSWGIDPPRAEQTPLPWLRESWRLWITNRLAIALLAAKNATAKTLEPWQFALERLRLEGIDPQTWTPSQSLWHTLIDREG